MTKMDDNYLLNLFFIDIFSVEQINKQGKQKFDKFGGRIFKEWFTFPSIKRKILYYRLDTDAHSYEINHLKTLNTFYYKSGQEVVWESRATN